MGTPRILIVDDDPDILLLLKMEMELAGYSATLAADGMDALWRLERENFDVVLLDLGMPTLDGFGVLEAINAGSAADNPKVVVVSAWPLSFYAERAATLGAAMYLEKPFDLADLHAVVRSFTLSEPSAGAAGPVEAVPSDSWLDVEPFDPDDWGDEPEPPTFSVCYRQVVVERYEHLVERSIEVISGTAGVTGALREDRQMVCCWGQSVDLDALKLTLLRWWSEKLDQDSGHD